MRKNILFITSCLLAATTFAEDINTLPKDTTKVIDIEGGGVRNEGNAV